MPSAWQFASLFTILVSCLLLECAEAKKVQLVRDDSSTGKTVHTHTQNIQNATNKTFASSLDDNSHTERAKRSPKAPLSSRENMQNIYNSLGKKTNMADWEMRRGATKNPMKPNSLRNLLQFSGQDMPGENAASTVDKFITPPMPTPLPNVLPLIYKTPTTKISAAPALPVDKLIPMKVSLVDLFNSDLVDFRTIINSPDWQKKFKDLVVAIEAYESKYFEKNPTSSEGSRGTDALNYNTFDDDYEMYDGNSDDESDDDFVPFPDNTAKTPVIPEKTIGKWESEVHNLPQPLNPLYPIAPIDAVNKTASFEQSFDKIAYVVNLPNAP